MKAGGNMNTTKEQREQIENLLNAHQWSIERGNEVENHVNSIYAILDTLNILDIAVEVIESKNRWKVPEEGEEE